MNFEPGIIGVDPEVAVPLFRAVGTLGQNVRSQTNALELAASEHSTDPTTLQLRASNLSQLIAAELPTLLEQVPNAVAVVGAQPKFDIVRENVESFASDLIKALEGDLSDRPNFVREVSGRSGSFVAALGVAQHEWATRATAIGDALGDPIDYVEVTGKEMILSI